MSCPLTLVIHPAIDEQLAWHDGFANLHPYQDEEDVQGALRLMWELERMLANITGMARMVHLGLDLTAKQVAELAIAGDECAQMIFESMGAALGNAIASGLHVARNKVS